MAEEEDPEKQAQLLKAKAEVYDLLALIQRAQARIKQLTEEIAKLS